MPGSIHDIHNRPTVLVVNRLPSTIAMIHTCLVREISCQILSANSLSLARSTMAKRKIDLLIIENTLSDGNGVSLIPAMHAVHQAAVAIVTIDQPCVEHMIQAIRSNAVDVLIMPSSEIVLVERVKEALKKQSALAQSNKRLVQLRDAMKRLNAARHVVTKKDCAGNKWICNLCSSR